MKKALQFALLLLVALAVGVWAWDRFAPASPEAVLAVAPAAPADDAAAHVVRVTYFTSDVRCPTCRTIEELTHRTIAERFDAEVEAGTLVFNTRNLDEPGNAHFAEDYELSFKTVVVSHRVGGEERAWAKFDDVWSHANDPEAFMLYLEHGIRAYLDVPAT
ncbi:MAG: nitrophenyl compound nitroreductase subunit ArsF family protein [Opitutales bacterium]